jgi:hypothetical protein
MVSADSATILSRAQPRLLCYWFGMLSANKLYKHPVWGMMKRPLASSVSGLVSLIFLAALATTTAQSQQPRTLGNLATDIDDGNDKIKNGEAAYIIGCTVADAMNIPACGELPTGNARLQESSSQDSADTSAAQAAIQELQVDASAVSIAAGQAMQKVRT